MTADPEQSLPLQVIATLKCGEEVTMLDNNEGYTVKIKTADGKMGYVAAIYVKKIPTPRRPPSVESASIENGVARWQQGAQGCDHFMSNGILVESLTANGITVQVSLHDTGWKLRANVAIANSGSQSIHIQPSQFILDDVSLHGKPLFYNLRARRRTPRRQPNRPAPPTLATNLLSRRPSPPLTTSFSINTRKKMPCASKANRL